MSRIAQPIGARGSLKWIQQAVNGAWPDLNEPLLARLPGARQVHWRSPLRADDFAEYRDADFLERLGLADLSPALTEFWPSRGPQWDALAVTDAGQVLLVEAKAHVTELCSPGSAARGVSRTKIELRLDELASRLGARRKGADWIELFYQFANRLAYLDFLRRNGGMAYLVLVNFINDADMEGPSSPEVWKAAYDVALYAMGLPKRHPLAPFVIEIYPDVSGKGAVCDEAPIKDPECPELTEEDLTRARPLRKVLPNLYEALTLDPAAQTPTVRNAP